MAIVRASKNFFLCHSSYWTISRNISTAFKLFNDDEKLENAKQKVMRLIEDPGNNAAKLQLYALYQQATVGECDTLRPGMMDSAGRAKWDSWNKLGNMDRAQAVQEYCNFVNSLVGGAHGRTSEETLALTSKPVTLYNGDLLVTDKDGVRTVTLNRPHKKNAITSKMFSDIPSILESAATDSSVRALVLTGSGDYYCSGNDISNFEKYLNRPPEVLAEVVAVNVKNYTEAYINFPKPLIAAINGPAVGISVTVLSLFDFVYAVDHATFHTPVIHLGQNPAGCSTFMFPRMMGLVKANEFLILGRKITAAEAYKRNLVTRVFPQEKFQEKVTEIAREIAQLPPNSVDYTKNLIRSTFRDTLLQCITNECEVLRERFLSEECAQAIFKFMNRRKK